MLISDAYREQNAMLHVSSRIYGGVAEKRLRKCLDILHDTGARSVLDYGCGKGGLVTALRGRQIEVRGYDPAVEEFRIQPLPADLVVCFEGPEHFEPDCVDECLKHIRSLTIKAAWIVTALRHGGDWLPDGRNAHVCVNDADWWLAKFAEHFKRTEIRARRDGDILDVLCLTH